MILFLLIIISIIFGVIAWKTVDYSREIIPIVSFVLCALGIIASFSVFARHLSVTIEPYRQSKYVYYKEIYDTLMYSIADDKNNIIVLSDNISEYNTAILSGRLLMDNIFTSYCAYDFYYDLDLIELDKIE